MHQGSAVNRIHGRNLPQRVLVRSASTPDDRIDDGVPQARRQENGRRRARRQAEDVRVEIGLEQNHRHEDEVRGGVGHAVADLFHHGELLRSHLHADGGLAQAVAGFSAQGESLRFVCHT